MTPDPLDLSKDHDVDAMIAAAQDWDRLGQVAFEAYADELGSLRPLVVAA